MRANRLVSLLLLSIGALGFSKTTEAASGYKLSILHSFPTLRNRDGIGPAGLLRDSSGNLYGVSLDAGAHHGHGAIWELTAGRSFKALYGFCADHDTCSDGERPGAPLIIDTAGNLYGTTSYGGANGRGGTVFELSPKDRGFWTLHTLYNFCSQANCADGAGPSGLTYAGAAAGVPYDGVSPLYSTTAGGGTGQQGTVFRLVPGQPDWSETVLYNFCTQGGAACSDGAFPAAGVLVSNSGSLFGTASQGGAFPIQTGDQGAGVAFELTQNGGSWTETILHNFCALKKCADGGEPSAPLIEDSAGNLYGTTVQGGRPCKISTIAGATCGVIFKLVPNGTLSQETVLYAFCARKACGDGAQPEAALLMDSSGNLFGTASEGGGQGGDAGTLGGGTAFELTAGQFHVLHKFCSDGVSCTDGWQPVAALVTDAAGDLFGTTGDGGSVGDGELFELSPKH
jgi:uncharacterized repeat protein (TIGR03803 family)